MIWDAFSDYEELPYSCKELLLLAASSIGAKSVRRTIAMSMSS
jgi:hypothetical protein